MCVKSVFSLCLYDIVGIGYLDFMRQSNAPVP